ncbi:hypothetical protein Sjap_009015 [Stephania japonica]|uniref:F-box domain-containing protein n=1 Tax=Stephania japonica TaxID=461633 RepID=A0AAP0JRE3_9MAGN
MMNTSDNIDEKYFPEEIFLEILIRLPATSLIRFMLVSKSWHALISDSHFIKLHLNKAVQDDKFVSLVPSDIFHLIDPEASLALSYPFNPHGVDLDFCVMGSCNGLLLLVNNRYLMGVWNPTTREFINIPSPVPPIMHCLGDNSPFYGLGYDSNTDDYKVVSIMQDRWGVVEAKIFSTSSCTWTTIKGWYTGNAVSHMPFFNFDDGFDNSEGKFVREAIYWLGELNEEKRALIAFNLEREEFKEIQLPEPSVNRREYHAKLKAWRQNLCLFTRSKSFPHPYEIFVMKRDSSWSKLYSIPTGSSLMVMTSWKVVGVLVTMARFFAGRAM